MVFRPIDLYVITSTFFTFFAFFSKSKKRHFLRFFAVFHTFSRTMTAGFGAENVCYTLCEQQVC